jgi:3-deoxy-D-manno-octulosonic-acid transferase/heptosyltransferase-1
MDILIIRLSAIGDVVHALSVLAPLKKHFSDCKITWVIEEEAADILKSYSGIDRVIVSRRKRWLRQLKSGQVMKALRQATAFVKTLRSQEYDLMLDFQGLFKSGIISFLSRSKRKIGYKNAREGSTLFYSEKSPATDFNDHAIKRHQVILKHLGINDSEISYEPLFDMSDERAVVNLFDNTGVDRNKLLVTVHPAATWKTKIWPKEKVVELCDRLVNEFSCQVVLIGSYAEEPFLTDMAFRAKNEVKNLAGKTKLSELACLIAKSDLLVTTDSGPMHIACASSTPVVAIMGPTAPWRTGPFGDDYRVVRHELPCSPCFKRAECPLEHHKCMEEISVEEVFKTCCNWLKQGDNNLK